MGCPVLTERTALRPGRVATGISFRRRGYRYIIVLCRWYAMSGTDCMCYATSGTGFCMYHAMAASITKEAHGTTHPIVLYLRYAMSGTDLAIVLRRRCAMSGADLGSYAIVLRCPVLT
eukprot:2349173-Rhodomonas_salina.2